ncbi:MAG: hypothetical protein K6G60_03255 [Lachnospiraceae bacterium]|nr:hypothetical protein [Lachnospiraceae bacterium]
MDKIIFEKIWQEGDLLEFKISAESEFVSAYQTCYVQQPLFKNNANKMINYIDNCTEPCYVEYGCKKGNYTPAFSMNIMEADNHGHVKIEVDIELADNDERLHRCCFYVRTELGQLERFSKELKQLSDGEIGSSAQLWRNSF